jgi:hypothetical protein
MALIMLSEEQKRIVWRVCDLVWVPLLVGALISSYYHLYSIDVVIAWSAIVVAILNLLKYVLGLPIRLGSSGEIENYPELAGIRLLLLIVSMLIGVIGIWWLIK